MTETSGSLLLISTIISLPVSKRKMDDTVPFACVLCTHGGMEGTTKIHSSTAVKSFEDVAYGVDDEPVYLKDIVDLFKNNMKTKPKMFFLQVSLCHGMNLYKLSLRVRPHGPSRFC